MTKILTVFLLFTSALLSKSRPANADSIIGKWMNTDKNLEVEVFKAGNAYQGRVLWFDDTDDKNSPMNDRHDTKNPDRSLRNRKIIGLVVMTGLVYNKDDDEWQDGRIYDSSSGKDWNAKAWINKEGMLKVRGYWHFSIFGQNISFKRIL